MYAEKRFRRLLPLAMLLALAACGGGGQNVDKPSSTTPSSSTPSSSTPSSSTPSSSTPSNTTPGKTTTVDTQAPTATISHNVTTATARAPVTFAIKFSEPVNTTIPTAAFQVSGGQVSASSVISTTQLNVTVNPTANKSGLLKLTLAAGKFKDLAGNLNTLPAAASVAFDTGAPPQSVSLFSFEETSNGAQVTSYVLGDSSKIIADPSKANNKIVRIELPAGSLEPGTGVTLGGCPLSRTPPLNFTTATGVISARVRTSALNLRATLYLGAATAKGETASEIGVFTAQLQPGTAWQNLSFDLSKPAEGSEFSLNPATQYDSIYIVFSGEPDASPTTAPTEVFLDDITVLGAVTSNSCPQPVLSFPLTFTGDNNTYTLIGLDGADAAPSSDPSGAPNNTAVGISVTTLSGFFSGVAIYAGPLGVSERTASIPFTAGRTVMSMKVWSPRAGTRFSLMIKSSATGKTIAAEAATTVAKQWQTLFFDFSKPGPLDLTVSYDQISVYVNILSQPTEDITVYIDDINF